MMSAIEITTLVDEQKRNALRLLVSALAFLVMFLDGFDLNLLGYVAPALMGHFGVTKLVFGSTVSAGLAGFMVGAFLLGDLGDRYGRRRLIIAGVALFGVVTLAGIFAENIVQLMLLRFIAGIGLGGAIPNAIALNAEYSPARSRASAIGIMFVGYTLGGAAPGWAAAALLPIYGWRAVFILGGALPLAAALVMVFILPESIKHLATRNAADPALKKLVARLRPDLALPPETRFIVEEEPRRGFPLLSLFRDGRAQVTLLLWIAFVANLMGLLFVISWTPTLLATYGIPAARAALLGAMFQTGGAFGSLAVGRITDAVGARAVWLSLACAVPTVGLIGVLGTSEVALVGIIFVAGFFATGGQIGLNALAGTFYPTVMRATGVGWAFGIGRVGAILGPMAGGALIAAELSPATLFACAAIPFLVAGVAIIALNNRYRDVARVSREPSIGSSLRPTIQTAD
jgi:MFS transporter, AAHS family, 4-hydroxybenzoate transporter